MGAVILCTFCQRKLTTVRYRYCTRPSADRTEHQRIGECCNTPARRAELEGEGWSIGELWVKGGGAHSGALPMARARTVLAPTKPTDR